MQQMSKTYDPGSVEPKLYERWLESGVFHAEAQSKKPPFCIVIPPPNITGQLHMGHALDETQQDLLSRYKRLRGFEVLWLPGTDHASIATEVKIVEQMAQEGLTKKDIGRDGFLERAWAWKEQYGGRIVEQLKKLGSSCDWQRERFTMDEGCSRAVQQVFIQLYEKGLIYRGKRIINWCVDCKTALSDAEVEYEEQNSHLWHIRYKAEDGNGEIVVATTRPETMLGDTAVAVHPDDKRYAHLVGKNVILPLMDRPIPVVADEYVEMEFGTGAVKITPAHDPNDFEVALRHDLPMIRVLDDMGLVNEEGGAYVGMERYAARKKVVEDLQAGGYLVSIEDYSHNVGACYRCNNIVEPILSDQWFVKMQPLAGPAINCVKDGRVRFVPERFEKTYFNWMENVRDWCISRQLWWGHRIPAYFCDCGEIIVSANKPEVCPKCGSASLRQDEDVLDTWFSSGLWPFSTLGWPDATPELEKFFPTSVLVTGYDIIFFWVARMIVFATEVMGDIPFSDVVVHGIVRDALGRKMSKSLGNGIDPLEIIEKYGADALRFSLVVGNAPGGDMRFSDEKAESTRNFTNKIWNASRFVMMNLDEKPAMPQEEDFSLEDKWILSRLDRLVQSMTEHLEKYDFGLAAQKLYDFIWSEFCDWYIEMAKPRLYGENKMDKQTAQGVLYHVLSETMILLHPFMPFISEEIYLHLHPETDTIQTQAWPAANAAHAFDRDHDAMQNVMDIIRQIRNIRAEMNVQPGKRTRAVIVSENRDIYCQTESIFARLAYIEGLTVQNDTQGIIESDICLVAADAQVFIPMAELVDLEKERARLDKEMQRLKGEIQRAEGKLNNPRFVDKAPAEVVQQEREKVEKYRDMLEKVEERARIAGGGEK